MLVPPLTILGFVLSGYVLYVRYKIRKDKSYSAICDMNDTVSCTKAAGSKHGSHFGIPNGVYGLIFYALFGILFLLAFPYIKYLAAFSVLGSVYLAYLSYKIQILCPICATIYLINIGLCLLSW